MYIVKNLMWVGCALNGNKKIHDLMLDRVIRSPVSFYDINPVGRILNRFSNDIGIIDRLLLTNVFEVLEGVCYFLAICVTIWVTKPVVCIPGFIGIGFYVLFAKKLIKPLRTLKVLELNSRSPLYSQLSLTLSGLIALRSFGQQANFVK